MFFNWLSLVAAGIAFWSAYAEGKKAGSHGTWIDFATGFLIGILCFCIMKAIIYWIPRKIGLYREGNTLRRHTGFDLMLIWLILILALAWLFLSVFMGSLAAKLVLKLG